MSIHESRGGGRTYAAWRERTQLSCCDANKGSSDDKGLHGDSWMRIMITVRLVRLSMLAYRVHRANSGMRFNCEREKLKVGDGTGKVIKVRKSWKEEAGIWGRWQVLYRRTRKHK